MNKRAEAWKEYKGNPLRLFLSVVLCHSMTLLSSTSPLFNDDHAHHCLPCVMIRLCHGGHGPQGAAQDCCPGCRPS